MDFELTDVQRRMVEMVRAFAEKEVAPRAAEIDRSDEWPRDLYRRLAELGCWG
jgi:alkylation response protein AidB-like acyl-CoA dehydrogenase